MNLEHLRPFTQIAFQVEDAERKKEELERHGAQNWVSDLVTSRQIVTPNGRAAGTEALIKLAFNYDLIEPKIGMDTTPQPVELEFVSVVHGQTCNVGGDFGELAHLGCRVDNLVAEVTRMRGLGFKLLQISQTVHHTGPHQNLYREAYFHDKGMFGCRLKFHQRLEMAKGSSDVFLAEAQALFGHMAAS